VLALGFTGEGAMPSRMAVGVRERDRFDPCATRDTDEGGAPPGRGEPEADAGEDPFLRGGGRVKLLPVLGCGEWLRAGCWMGLIAVPFLSVCAVPGVVGALAVRGDTALDRDSALEGGCARLREMVGAAELFPRLAAFGARASALEGVALMATRGRLDAGVAVLPPFIAGRVTRAVCVVLTGVTERGRGLTDGTALFTRDIVRFKMGVAARSFGCGDGEGI
jgi:hypothetical protein